MKILSDIRQAETFAKGNKIREIKRLRESYGGRDWRKRKGFAIVDFHGVVGEAETHWYECSGVGKVEFKVKEFLS